MVGELVYFFYLSGNNQPKLVKAPVGNISNPNKPFLDPTVNEITAATFKVILKNITRGVVVDSNIITQYKGKIIKILDKNIDKSSFIGGYNPVLQIALQTESNTNLLTIFESFNKDEINVTYIQPIKDSNDNLTLLNIKDLKVGQTIEITEKFNLKTNRIAQILIFIAK